MMKLIPKIRLLWIVLFFASLLPVDSTSVAAANASEEIDSTMLLASGACYTSSMNQGYAATNRRNYRRARSHFQKALGCRPGDRYATRAIANMNRYISRGRKRNVAYSTGRSSRTSVGATRGSCFQNEQARKSIIPLIPSDADGVTTTAEYPSLLFHVPRIPEAKSLELVVQDKNFKTLHKVALSPNQRTGIIRANLTSQTGQPLALNKQYNWVFSVICDSSSRSTDWTLGGTVQRIQPNQDVSFDLKTAAPQDKVEIYVNNKLWENALRTVVDLRRQNPNDAEIKQYWRDLLKSVGFQDEVIQAPLL
ncbi:MAG: DUF928 domain-containing protein [Cyanobacteria bacterium P01_D01_bin.116]